jgi:hypothetical protein
MKGIEYRLVMALMFIIVLVVATNFNYIFVKKNMSTPGPTPGPTPETMEEEFSLSSADVVTAAIAEAEEDQVPMGEEVSLSSADVLTNAIIEAQENPVAVADVKVVEALPIEVLKKERYVAYSNI